MCEAVPVSQRPDSGLAYFAGTVDKAKSVWFWIQNVLFPIGSLLLLILLFLTLMRMER